MADTGGVQQVPAHLTFALRRRVLDRDPAPVETEPPHDGTRHAHFAVLADDRVIGTAVLIRRPPPGSPDGPDPLWQMLGVAVDPEHRRRGLGRHLVGSALEHIAQQGGGVVWCHARQQAVDLYRRLGFTATGDAFDDPVAGRQLPMAITVEARPSGS